MNAFRGKPYELRKAGVKALQDALGCEDATEFLESWRNTPGDEFNKWLSEQPKRPKDETDEEIEFLLETTEKLRRAKAQQRANEAALYARTAGHAMEAVK